MFTPGQPAQISAPPVLAPRDDRAADPASTAHARTALWNHLRRWEGSVALLLISTVFSMIQGATQNIIGIDGYYHVKVALLMREQGWRLLAPLDFPWLQQTILGPGRYADHHFLFHVLQAPFTIGDPRIGAKMAAVLFAVLGLYTTYLFLSRFGVRYPVLWIALLLACAPIFLWRQSMARTQSLSLLLIVLGLWALFARRPGFLLPVGFAAAWLFNGFFFVVGAPLAAVLISLGYPVARRWWLRDDRNPQHTEDNLTPQPAARREYRLRRHHLRRGEGELDALVSPSPRRAAGWGVRSFVGGWGVMSFVGGWGVGASSGPEIRFALAALGWILCGVGLGLLLHPYFPRNVEFAFFHLLPKANPAEQASVTVGQEWYPYSFNGFMVRAGPTSALCLLGLVPIFHQLWLRRWPDWRTMVLAILAFGFLAMVSRSQRIIEYFPAIAVIFCAWSWSHADDTIAAIVGFARSRLPDRPYRVAGRALRIVPFLLLLGMLPFIWTSTRIAAREAGEGQSWTAYRDGALWLADNTPPGALVFTTGWDDFPPMFFWNTHNTYLVGLDPTYSSLEDPEGYQLWRSISQGRVPNPSRQILERFGARYVLTDMLHERFIEVASKDPGLEMVLRTRTVVVYRVRDG